MVSSSGLLADGERDSTSGTAMNTPRSRTQTLARTALGAALLTACGDAPAVVDTNSASGGENHDRADHRPHPHHYRRQRERDRRGHQRRQRQRLDGDEPTTGACPPGALDCAGACVDVMGDPDHCGGCDAPCAPGESCQQGACVAACDPGLTACDGACVDLTVDPEHCGGCDLACDPGLSCQDSACVELELVPTGSTTTPTASSTRASPTSTPTAPPTASTSRATSPPSCRVWSPSTRPACTPTSWSRTRGTP